MSDPNENCTKFASKRSENKKFVRIQHKKVPEMVEKEWKMTSKNTYETYNAFQKYQKVSNPNEIFTKMPSKPSKNKKFKRMKHKKVGELNENHTRKQSNETWKT